jgi:hypothetical protein
MLVLGILWVGAFSIGIAVTDDKVGENCPRLTGSINDAKVRTYALSVHTPSVAPMFKPSATYSRLASASDFNYAICRCV